MVESLSELEYSASKVTGAAIAVPIAQIGRLAAFVERVFSSKHGLPWTFETMVVDFVHGDDGRWWMVGLRDFRLKASSYASCHAILAARDAANAEAARDKPSQTLASSEETHAASIL